MPDTFTHIAIPSLFSGYLKKFFIVPILLIGTVLPDYFREFFGLLLPLDYYAMTYPFHSLLGIFCISLFLSSFFIITIRKAVFYSFFTGQLIHLLFDSTQLYFNGGRIYILFPYFKSLSFQFIPASSWFTIFYISFSIFLLVHIWRFIQKKKVSV